MKQCRILSVSLFTVACMLICAPFSDLSAKTRVVVMTDIGGDPDDHQSLVRFLLYANEFEIEGITVGLGKGHTVESMPDMAIKIIDAYAKDLPNLRKHSPDFPDAAVLKSMLKKDVDSVQHNYKTSSDASKLIVEILKKNDDRPIWFQGWGGPRALAAALYSLSGTLNDADFKKIRAKIRVYDIYGQDNTAAWIRETYPDIFYIHSKEAFRGMYLLGDLNLVKTSWIDTYIKNHGEISKEYPGGAVNQVGVKEGDTPAFLYLIPNGLSDPQYPDWSSWGGKYTRVSNTQFKGDDRLSIAQWRPEYQADFASRLDWTTKSFDAANHPPVVDVNGDKTASVLRLKASASQTIQLDGSKSSDPDSDNLTFSWTILEDVSNKKATITPNGNKAAIKFGADFTVGSTLHVLLTVKDSGEPSVTRYKRVVFDGDVATGTKTNSEQSIIRFMNNNRVVKSFPGADNYTTSLKIIDPMSRVVASGVLKNDRSCELSYDHLSSGLYFLVEKSNSGDAQFSQLLVR